MRTSERHLRKMEWAVARREMFVGKEAGEGERGVVMDWGGGRRKAEGGWEKACVKVGCGCGRG